MKKQVLKIPEAAEKVITDYFELPLGGKKVKTPYFMNIRKQRGGLRVLVGKGKPSEIMRETKVWAQLKGLDLEKASSEQIRKFMLQQDIGIDCSGYVVHILNHWLKSEGKALLINYLKFFNNSLIAKLRRKLRPVENIGANLLTSELNCEKIEDVNQLRPGDFIRSKGLQKNSHHLLLIIEVHKKGDVVEKFIYTNASRHYGEHNGVRTSEVIIENPKAGLKEQKWQDLDNDRNYTYEELLKDYEDNGIRRLKNISLNYQTLALD